MACSYCYTRRMYKRFKWNPEIRFEPETLLDLAIIPDGSKVFVGSTIELFGDWVKHEWLEHIFNVIKRCPWATCIVLTKQPQNLLKWSPFPENCWVGVSAVATMMLIDACQYLRSIDAKVKFISFEPLLDWDVYGESDLTWRLLKDAQVNWLIIGSQTQPIRHPRREWVEEILEAADKAKIPVFVKEPLASHLNIHREEWPK